MKTFQETLEHARENRKWWIVNAEGKVVGRIASEVAAVLRGKRNPRFTPTLDAGDCVIVINAEKAEFTRNKLDSKRYYKHTGFIGNVKEKTAKQFFKTKPEEVIATAVQGMLPKTTLGRQQLKKLWVYTGAQHPHIAQNPQELKV